jgi:predicted nucleic acid-binding protein
MKTYILDSNAFLAYLKNEKGSKRVSQILLENITGKSKCLMSLINYGEVLYNSYRYFGSEKLQKIKNKFVSLEVEIMNTNVEEVYQAVEFKNRGGIAYCDCFVLALAKKHQATIVTGDQEFKKFEKEFKVEWL